MRKHKKFNRKLKLSKQTVVRLEQNETKNVKGGATQSCFETLCVEFSCVQICPCLNTALVTIEC